VLVARVTSQPSRGSSLQSAKPVLHALTRHSALLQTAMALGGAHIRLQPPQCARVLSSGVSQPSAALPLQSPKPELHDSIAHAPARHTGVARGVMHARPHAPQWASVDASVTSQPLPAALSQLAKPGAQAMPHTLPEQVAAALGAVGHTLLQRAQWAGLVASGVSQPSAVLPLQLPKPARHSMPQAPAVQVATVLGGVGHAKPHIPQCEVLVWRLAQVPPQLVSPGAQVVPQALALQFCPAEHARPHPPQCAKVLRVLVSQPLATFMSQLPRSMAQAMAQTPAAHEGVPPAEEQARPHVPQCLTSVARGVSQPLAGLLSQSPKPALHDAMVHAPATQRAEAFGRAQGLPHPPQWVSEVRVSASQPLPLLPSQSAKPGSHIETRHTPSRQTGVPPAVGHAFPQRPQCVRLVAVDTSQPLAGFMSQSAKPGLQEATMHAPPSQVGVALESAQTLPQRPQCELLVRRSVHATPEQRSKPIGHPGWDSSGASIAGASIAGASIAGPSDAGTSGAGTSGAASGAGTSGTAVR
jgi:hypothetical protein